MDLIVRPRRLRRTAALRAMVRENRLSPDLFILPLFVVPGTGVRNPVGSMPGVEQVSVDHLPAMAREIRDLGIRAVLLFGIPETKDAVGSGAYQIDGIIPRAIRAIKEATPDLLVVTDVCLCEYTDHGHCGLLDGEHILNDETLPLLAMEAVAHARAGADIIAPSDMMDGRVRTIREALDLEGFSEIAILSYSVKYASAFYGPFREAAQSTPAFGDRRTHQMDPANAREALREAELDVAEGADMLMVKPALAYLDVIRTLKDRFLLPVAAYQVSGEYAMVKAAAAAGWLDEKAVVLETLTAIRRAGADLIITYWAREAARWLQE